MTFRERRRRRANINLTSLIDVLFLLLIFFMVSTTFVKGPGLALDLPAAESSQVVDQGPITLTVASAGEVYLNDEPVPEGLLGTALERQVEKSREAKLVLKADKGVSYGRVVEVLDIVKGSGIRFLTLATRLPPPPAEP
jgi:biopolymer transport protein ExbD